MTLRIGAFQIVETVHQGTFSAVHRCRDVGVRRDVAVKAISPVTSQPTLALEHLEREAAVRGSVQHPNLLALYGRRTSRTGPLLVGPWMAAGTLEDRVRGPLAASAVAAVAQQLGAALDALHAGGWWHGDVSAGNVLLDARARDAAGQDPGWHVVLSDFGASRRLGARAAEHDMLVTTPVVAAPELWAGHSVGASSDLYSLGVLVYLALTGEYPFDPENPAELADLHCDAPVPPPSDLVAIGRDLEDVVLRSLSKRPNDRFASGAEMAAALRAALDERRDEGASGMVAHRRPSEALRGHDLSNATVRELGARLGRFAEDELEDHERLALSAVLELARIREADAITAMGRHAMQLFGPPNALLALEQTGAAHALVGGPRTARQIAETCGACEDVLGQILALLACMGFLKRSDDHFALSPELKLVYGDGHQGGAAPIREAARLWGHLPQRALRPTPAVEMDEPSGSAYAEVMPWMGSRFGKQAGALAGQLREMGAVAEHARVLDVGAGSAVWSLALAARDPTVTVTALDRPLVLRVARSAARAAGLSHRLALLAGDWRDSPITDGGFNLAILANICHLEPGEDVLRLLIRTRDALCEGGTVVIVDTIPARPQEDPGALLQSLHVSLRTPHGRIHGRGDYDTWLRAAGYAAAACVPLSDGLTALVAAATRPVDRPGAARRDPGSRARDRAEPSGSVGRT